MKKLIDEIFSEKEICEHRPRVFGTFKTVTPFNKLKVPRWAARVKGYRKTLLIYTVLIDSKKFS